jgi:hypothetical protein
MLTVVTLVITTFLFAIITTWLFDDFEGFINNHSEMITIYLLMSSILSFTLIREIAPIATNAQVLIIECFCKILGLVFLYREIVSITFLTFVVDMIEFTAFFYFIENLLFRVNFINFFKYVLFSSLSSRIKTVKIELQSHYDYDGKFDDFVALPLPVLLPSHYHPVNIFRSS